MAAPSAGRPRLPLRLLLTVVLGVLDFATSLTVSGHDFDFGDQGAQLVSDDGGPYKWKPDKYWPSVFVAIFSRRSALARRAKIRGSWKRADFGQGKLITRFALCDGSGSSADGLAERLAEESDMFGDIMLMSCAEGYGQGLLTRKTLASMQAYSHSPEYSQQQLFMKIDDDTFAAWSRLWPWLARGWENSTDHFYMGTIKAAGKPSRDPLSPFYEPPESYPRELYPKSADGGPGYIIGGSLVRKIVDERIADSWILHNEDKAVAVWVDGLVERGETVDYINIEGHTGYALTQEQWDGQLKWFHRGRWVGYPLLLHHRLSGEAISCLSEVESLKNPNATIDHCFTSADNTWIPTAFMKQADGMGFELWLKIYGGKKLNSSRNGSRRI